jgi:hypothetical protein
VLTAGEFEIVGGKLTQITNQSGHFRPSAQSFEHFLVELHEQGVDLNGVRALALTLKTDADGRFSLAEEAKDVLQHPEEVHPGSGTMLAPLAPPLGWWRPAEKARSHTKRWWDDSEWALPRAA